MKYSFNFTEKTQKRTSRELLITEQVGEKQVQEQTLETTINLVPTTNSACISSVHSFDVLYKCLFVKML